ncbi:MAG: class I SAM-dependent methyltransferase [Acidimicrobiales bacterium]|nr:class I SAM-dependent methyltransferase [Acidimicrobiales bacterium]
MDRWAGARAAGVRSVKRGLERGLADDRTIAARARPLRPDEDAYVLRPVAPPGDGSGPADWPVPDPDRWELEEEDDRSAYLASGELHASNIRRAAADHGLSLGAGDRVLEFGCGFGRVLRWWPAVAPGVEAWGVDLEAERVAWARAHLPAGFRLATCTTAPHLPFPDASFELVYACSVIPHISELADAWVLELRRVLAPGGLAYLTVYDEDTIAAIRRTGESPNLRAGLDALEARVGPVAPDFDVAVLNRRAGAAQVFQSSDYLARVWGGWFEVLDRRPEEFHVQTAMVLRREDDRGPHRVVPEVGP